MQIVQEGDVRVVRIAGHLTSAQVPELLAGSGSWVTVHEADARRAKHRRGLPSVGDVQNHWSKRSAVITTPKARTATEGLIAAATRLALREER